MWDLPGPGLEPVSPALPGRFLTTAPPGKSQLPWIYIFKLERTYQEAFMIQDWCQNTGSLYTNAKMRYGDRVLEEKGWLYTLPGKKGTQQASASRNVPPSLGNRERSYSWVLWSGVFGKDQGSNSLAFFFLLQSFKRVGLLTRLGCVKGLRWSGSPNLDELLWSLYSCLRWFRDCSSHD